jgi:hypothetical protein
VRFWNKSKVSSLSVWLSILRQDSRFALRALAKAPAFSAIAVTTLALGVGANTATFSILKAVSLNQLPFGDPDRLVTIAESDGHTTNPQSVAVPTVYDFRQRSEAFEALSLWGDFAMRPVAGSLVHARRRSARHCRQAHSQLWIIDGRIYRQIFGPADIHPRYDWSVWKS